MRKVYVIICLYLFTNKAFCQVHLSGEIKNAPAASEVNVTYYNNNIEWKEITAAQTKLDAQGKFTLSFKLVNPGTATLVIGEQQTTLFLLPGFSLYITDDYDNFDSTIIYTGRGAADNNYVAADLFVDFEKQANRYNSFNDADQYKLYEDSIEKLNWDFFKTHDTHEFSPEFRNYMTATLKYRFINSRSMYKVGYDKVNKKFYDKPVPENYFDFLKTIDLNDEQAIDNVDYYSSLMHYLNETNDSKASKEVPDSLADLQKMEMRIMKYYSFRKNVFKGKVLDYQLTDFMKYYIGKVIADKTFTDELIKDYKATCKNAEYIAIIDKIVAQANKLAAGNPAPDFTLVNADGKASSLLSLKGKTVYIDFWATWCVPCIAAMKRSHELMEKFKDRKDVVFLYVNVDDDKERWKNYLVKEKMQGVNLFADKDQSAGLFKNYNFNGIPHYVLIDKQCKLVNANAADPGDAEKAILDASK